MIYWQVSSHLHVFEFPALFSLCKQSLEHFQEDFFFLFYSFVFADNFPFPTPTDSIGKYTFVEKVAYYWSFHLCTREDTHTVQQRSPNLCKMYCLNAKKKNFFYYRVNRKEERTLILILKAARERLSDLLFSPHSVAQDSLFGPWKLGILNGQKSWV